MYPFLSAPIARSPLAVKPSVGASDPLREDSPGI